MLTTEPSSEHELLTRALRLAGATLGELAREHRVEQQVDPRRAKGWIGQLIERALGVNGGSRRGPDVRGLNIEIKTVPLAATGRPRESTFVCTAPLAHVVETPWESSCVYAKLQRVLWVPIEGNVERALSQRRVGRAALWSPNAEEASALRGDWDELAEWIGAGRVDLLTAHVGRVLQVRPKAASAASRCVYVDADGVPTRTLPRGFYLRTAFTERIISSSLGLKS